MDLFDIYNCSVRWGHGESKVRPWLIVRVTSQVHGFPISSVCYEMSGFFLDAKHPDFPHTGLKNSCYILDGRAYVIRDDELRTRRGRLAGNLLADFRRYAGI